MPRYRVVRVISSQRKQCLGYYEVETFDMAIERCIAEYAMHDAKLDPENLEAWEISADCHLDICAQCGAQGHDGAA